MPGFNPENINIHDLTIEEPEKEDSVFNVESEFTEEDWAKINNTLGRRLTSNKENPPGQANALKFAVEVEMLGHKVDLPEEAQQVIEEHLKVLEMGALANDNWSTFALYAASLKRLGINIELTNLQKSKMLKNFQKFQSSLDIDTYIDLAIELNILGEKVSLSPEGEQEFLKILDYHRKDKDNWVSKLASKYKILIGDPQLTQEELERIKERMRELVGGEFKVEEAAELIVLLAEKAEITDKGLEITTPKSKLPETETPPLPETKNF